MKIFLVIEGKIVIFVDNMFIGGFFIDMVKESVDKNLLLENVKCFNVISVNEEVWDLFFCWS